MSKLKDYQRKRDFTKTKEPSGKKKIGKRKKPIFVIQEHHARRLHYDFRLELDGVLKSWAVPKGPSMDPKDKRLAVQTEDHPLEYAKFHGTIPEGEYGAGEVFIWDKGTWESEDSDPEAALEKGELKFRVKGKKIDGSFVLVRTNYMGNTNKNWLLIKHKEDAKRVSKKKTKRPSKLSRDVGEDPWPGFIRPQLPKLVTSVPSEGRWLHEIKYDGYRIQAHIQNGVGKLLTRTGLNWSRSFPHLLQAIEGLPVHDAILDGEIVAFDEDGHINFQNLQNSIKDKSDKYLRYCIFDLLYLNGQDLRELPLLERKEKLKELLKGADSEIEYADHVMEDAEEFFQVSCEHELEGMISKMADAPYRTGRNELWQKIKCKLRQEFVIAGWTEPQGGRVGLGALVLGVYHNKKLQYVGKVGTGFTERTLKSLKLELEKRAISSSPFAEKVSGLRKVHWVKPDLICEVSFGNWTDDGVLRTPVFEGLRSDKSAKDVHKEVSKAILTREVSSPDKVLFPIDHKTKSDVAHYYQAVSEYMLASIADRPLSLVRCPEGALGTCFYQKHFTGDIPSAFHQFLVKEEKDQGTYIAIEDSAGLLELAQLNAFEIHCWNSRFQNLMRPDQIVMDLDPGPEVSLDEIVAAALELKEMLLDLELDSFVKVTGGKGLHIHVPIEPLYDWDQVKAFAQSLALELESRNSKLYTTNMSKKVRKQRIFIDYLRNGFGATAVAPYSLRAKEVTAVALPVEWKELKQLKSFSEFTMDRALKKIQSRKRDPWEDMYELKQRVPILRPIKEKKAA